ncbi:nucleolar complex protein 2, putative [Plasmodium ovale curtisi]|uniref:Nucleolar complex protein 2, putative n=1 Tax=Plasmodium ovale curtisi TaxID=864141 RepID=A0A1A8WUW7_PLAOA|nr:nucleolar complex protein 2, putative [Plasmodium ovale curtisi]
METNGTEDEVKNSEVIWESLYNDFEEITDTNKKHFNYIENSLYNFCKGVHSSSKSNYNLKNRTPDTYENNNSNTKNNENNKLELENYNVNNPEENNNQLANLSNDNKLAITQNNGSDFGDLKKKYNSYGKIYNNENDYLKNNYVDNDSDYLKAETHINNLNTSLSHLSSELKKKAHTLNDMNNARKNHSLNNSTRNVVSFMSECGNTKKNINIDEMRKDFFRKREEDYSYLLSNKKIYDDAKSCGNEDEEIEEDDEEEDMEYDDITELENFCKKYNIDNEDSSSDDNMDNANDELLLDEEGQSGEKVIDIDFVHNFLESINKKVRLNKVVKLLAIFEDALNLYHIEEIDDGYSKMENKNEKNDNINNEDNKTMKKNKRNKKGENNKKRNFRMNVDTSVYIIFNVLYNINNIFYNIMNDGNLNINMISLDDIKNNKIVESEFEKNEKDMNKSDIIYDLENMSKYKHINRYRPCIIYFFNKIIIQLNKLKNCNDIFLSILKIIKRKEILRWAVILNYGKKFLKKISHLFICSKKSEIYFLLYILIQNMFQLYNERKRIIFTNLTKTKYEDEHNQIKNTYDMEKLLYGIYQHIFQIYVTHYGPKSDNILNWNDIHFKENCLVELFTYLSHDVAYNIAFRYVQLIIQKIREEFKVVYDEKGNEKSKEKKKKFEQNKKTKYLYLEQLRLHTPQMIIILKFLMKITKQCDNLSILTYGLTTLIIGILKMKINNMRYLPFNLQLINFLIRIMEDKKKYIPLFSYLVCILNGLKNYKNNKNVPKNQNEELYRALSDIIIKKVINMKEENLYKVILSCANTAYSVK